jgi:MtN3 and saliva related transmembrane protein
LNWQELLGFASGALTTFALLPQVWRLFKLKSAHEISLLFTFLLLFGIIGWIIFGILFDLAPLILWNSVTLVFLGATFYAKFKYGRNSR